MTNKAPKKTLDCQCCLDAMVTVCTPSHCMPLGTKRGATASIAKYEFSLATLKDSGFS